MLVDLLLVIKSQIESPFNFNGKLISWGKKKQKTHDRLLKKFRLVFDLKCYGSGAVVGVLEIKNGTLALLVDDMAKKDVAHVVLKRMLLVITVCMVTYNLIFVIIVGLIK